jgi:hypothetical protein
MAPKKKFDVLLIVLYKDNTYSEVSVRVEAQHDDAAADEAMDQFEKEADELVIAKKRGLVAYTVNEVK